MPISKDILERLEKNDSTLVHLDLTFQFDLSFDYLSKTYLSNRYEQYSLTDEDIVELGEAWAHNTHLKSLNLNQNKVGVLGISILATKRLEALSLSKNGLNSDCIDALMLHDMLSSLDVSGNRLDDEDIAKLGQHPRISSLDVSENKVGPLSMNAFALNTVLRKLSIKENQLEQRGYANFRTAPLCIEALKRNSTLEWLDITGNIIRIKSFKALSRHPELQILNLEQCFFYKNNFDEPNNFNRVLRVISHIAKIPKLTWLSIREINPSNNDVDKAARLLARVPLKYLDVSNTVMSALGAKALASSATLTTVIARENHIGPYGHLALAKNRSITHLDLSGNNIKSYPGYGNNHIALRRNLVEWESNGNLNFGNNYNPGVMTKVMNAFEQNNTLQKLNISHQISRTPEHISDAQFASLIKNNTNIMSLDLSHSNYNVGHEVINALAENNTLRAITFSADLDNKAHQEALSKNDNLMTIRCVSVYRQELAPYAQKIQERNRCIHERDIGGMRVLMLHAMKGACFATNNCRNVIGNLDLLIYIASFYLRPAHVQKTSLTAYSIFNRKIECAGQGLKRQRTDGIESAEPALQRLRFDALKNTHQL